MSSQNLTGTAPAYDKGKKEIYAESHLKDVLRKDPRVRGVTNLAVDYEKLGPFKGRCVHIAGHVRHEADRSNIEQVVRENIEKHDKVSNELKVDNGE